MLFFVFPIYSASIIPLKIELVQLSAAAPSAVLRLLRLRLAMNATARESQPKHRTQALGMFYGG